MTRVLRNVCSQYRTMPTPKFNSEPGLLNVIGQDGGLQASEIRVDNHAEGDQIVHGNLTSALLLASSNSMSSPGTGSYNVRAGRH